MYGTMWITNGSHSYRIKKDSPIPEGYKKGRLAIKAKVKQYRVEVSWHGKV
jgi:hypothetical protein